MKDYSCINLKFKNKSISKLEYHAHLFIKKDEIIIQVIDNEPNSNVDRKFAMSDDSFGFFDDVIEIIDSEYKLLVEDSRINRTISFKEDEANRYFTIFLTSICIIKPSYEHKYAGKAFLNHNGLKLITNFYSFFTNFKDKNKFEISRMNDMHDYYSFDNLNYRPEFDFWGSDSKFSEEFSIKKIPIINFDFKDLEYNEVKSRIEIICNLLSFCYSIRIEFSRLTVTVGDETYIYANFENINNNYVSEALPIFFEVKKQKNIQGILKSSWHKNYILQTRKMNKAIDNYLHSREVDGAANYLLLFNILEIFNAKQESEKFEFEDNKDSKFEEAFKIIESSLTSKKDAEALRDKWIGISDKLLMKPMKSPLEQTLLNNNINAVDFGFPIGKLKSVRDKLTHGSVNSINENKLKEYTFAIRHICSRLILSQLELDH